MSLIGRAEELETLEAVIESARSGFGAALVVHGEAGVGKTALLVESTRPATDCRVLHLTAPETDMELAFGALNRLLAPFAGDVDRLPPQSRDVLHGAFGLAAINPGERHMVGLAALSLLSWVGRERPVVCVVDDAHWLDRESRDALVLVGRRLGADRVAVLFGVRDPIDDWHPDLPRLEVRGLAEPDALRLVESVAHRTVDAERARRIVVDSSGLPMAILELAGVAHAPVELDDTVGAPGGLTVPVTQRIEHSLLQRARSLSPAAQELLLVAALDTSGDARIVMAAGTSLGIRSRAAEAVAEAGLLELGPTVTFRHPLVRSAVRDAASAFDRRRVHRALAEAFADATGDSLDRERRTWHRSAAAVTADDDVASELAELAAAAQRRGAHVAAGANLARAAELTSHREQRAGRVLEAVAAFAAGGATERARELLAQSAPLFESTRDRARSMRLHGVVRYDAGDATGTVAALIAAAREFYAFDPDEARLTLMRAFAAARITGRFALPGEGVVAVCAAARSMPRVASGEPSALDNLLDGSAALFLDGHRTAVPLFSEGLRSLRQTPIGGHEGIVWMAMGCWAAGAIGDDVALHDLSERLVVAARAEGALAGMAHGLLYAGMSELFSGSLEAARGHFDERSELMKAIGRPLDVGDLITFAWSGREAEARAGARSVAAYGAQRSYGWMMFFVEYAMCVLELGLGNYRAAFDTAVKNYDESPFLCLTSFPDLIEAAVRCGEHGAAERALDELNARALPNQTPLALGLLARSRALLADEATADDLYREALELLGRSRAQIQFGRTQLLYGEWLRRRKRRLDARQQLRSAHQLFANAGAGAFAERARRELVATGEHTRARASSLDELTPQERAIAELAATGATNAEIATKLFLSPATVDYHLRKVYRKLAISSRRHLAAALTRSSTPDV